MRKLIIALAALLPVAAFSNGYDVPNVSPRDLSMAASLIAAQQDAGAAYACPAALARLQGLSVSIGGTLLDIDTTWTPNPDGTPPSSAQAIAAGATTTEWHPAFPFAAFISYSGKIGDHGAGIGFGANVPGGGNVFWPADWAGRSRIITVDRRVYGLYLTGGYEIIPQIRVGGGLVYYRSTEHLTQGLDPTPSTAELSTAGGAASFDVSLEVDALPNLRLAADYKHQVYQDLTGTAHFAVDPTLQPLLQDQAVQHTLPYPSTLQVGVAWDVSKAVKLTGTYTYNRYRIYQEDRFVGALENPPDIVVPRNYGDGHVFRVGAEWLASPQLALRVGALRDISGMPKEDGPNGQLLSNTYSPTLPDSNSWAGAVGAGWSFAKNLTVNAAVFYAHMDEVQATGAEAFPGIYNTHVFIYALGVSYNWLPGNDFLSSF